MDLGRGRELGRGGALSARVGLGGGGAIWEMMEESGTSDDGGGRWWVSPEQ